MEGMSIEEQKAINEFVKRALDNARKVDTDKKNEDGTPKNYLDATLEQRLEGKDNAGSSYNFKSKEELYDMLTSQNWEETTHPDVKGCRLFKCNLPGNEGILDINEVPENVRLYAIDPKNTGKVEIGAANVNKKPAKVTYILIGTEPVNGEELTYCWTFYPGEPIKESKIESKDIPDGTVLTLEEAKKLGFTKIKYMSPEMVKAYEEKNKQPQKSLTGGKRTRAIEKANKELSMSETKKTIKEVEKTVEEVEKTVEEVEETVKEVEETVKEVEETVKEVKKTVEEVEKTVEEVEETVKEVEETVKEVNGANVSKTVSRVTRDSFEATKGQLADLEQNNGNKNPEEEQGG